MMPPLLQVEDLSVRHQLARGTFFRPAVYFDAVRAVSFALTMGRTLGLVGESGCGKTTTALAIMRLIAVTSGRIMFDGVDIALLSNKQMRPLRAGLQMIFQDPYSALDPRRRVGKSVAATLRLAGHQDTKSENEILAGLFEEVGLRNDHLALYPHQFSGGQRQRIAIARALAGRPRLVVCDEPTSALDAAVQAQILNLLRQLQEGKHHLAYLFVSHDLAVVHHMCHDVAVMYMGRIVESAPRARLFSSPRHPYTRALLASAPFLSRKRGTPRFAITGEPPQPDEMMRGCRFASRCPYAEARCRETEPLLRRDGDHAVACHLA